MAAAVPLLALATLLAPLAWLACSAPQLSQSLADVVTLRLAAAIEAAAAAVAADAAMAVTLCASKMEAVVARCAALPPNRPSLSAPLPLPCPLPRATGTAVTACGAAAKVMRHTRLGPRPPDGSLGEAVSTRCAHRLRWLWLHPYPIDVCALMSEHLARASQ